jgi:WD40 repeat protein
MIAAPPSASRFASLAELQESHTKLAQAVAKDVVAPGNLEQILEFVRRSVATGALLDAPADRSAAQSLITYWTAKVASALRDRALKGLWLKGETPDPESLFEDTLLAEFSADALYAAVIEPADQWWRRQAVTEQTHAKRIVLRLVKLRDDKDNTIEVCASANGVCDDLNPRDRAELVLADLIKLGVVRTVRTDAGQDEVALRSPALIDRWDLLRNWIADRKAFRRKATDWARRRADKERAAQAHPSRWRRIVTAFRCRVMKLGAWIDLAWRTVQERLKLRQHDEDMLTPDEFEEAETYRDRIPSELKLIYQKRMQDKERAENRQAALIVAISVGVVLALVSAWAVIQMGIAETQRNLANEHEKDANTQRVYAQQQKAAADAKTAEVIEWTKKLEIERTAKIHLLDAKARHDQSLRLVNLAESSMVRSPRKSVLLAVEAVRSAHSGIDDGKSENENELLDEVRVVTEETLRKTLGAIGGMGLYADIGAIEQLAVHEEISDEEKIELRWLAAAGSKGLICLWDRPRANKTNTPMILPFGYAPPFRQLTISEDGRYLIALNARNNITVWNLKGPDRTCCVFAGDPSAPNQPKYQLAGSSGKWMAIDDRVAKGKLVHLGNAKEGPETYDVNWTDPANPNPAQTLDFLSFSADGRWFARITATGEAFVCELQAPGEVKTMPHQNLRGKPDKNPPAKSRAVNGEFLDDSKRLVVYLDNGIARYWDLKGERWNESAEEVDLKEVMEIKESISAPFRVLTDARGTHVLLMRGVSYVPDPSKNPAVADAFCIDGKDLHSKSVPVKRLRGFDWRMLVAPPVLSDTGRWLIVRSSNGNLHSWDLGADDKGGVNSFQDFGRSFSVLPEGLSEFMAIPRSPFVITRGNFDNTVHWLNLALGNSLSLRGHDDRVQAFAHSQQGRWLVTGAADGTIRAWNLNPLSPSAEPTLYRSLTTRSIVSTADKRWYVSSLPDGSMRFFPLEKGCVSVREPFRFTPANRREAANLFPSVDGGWLLERSPQAPIAFLWDLRGTKPKRSHTLEIGDANLDSICANGAGTWLAAQVTQDGGSRALFWRLDKTKMETVLVPTSRNGEFLAFLAAGDQTIVKIEDKLKHCDLSKESTPPKIILKKLNSVKKVVPSASGNKLLVIEARPNSDSSKPTIDVAHMVDLGEHDKSDIRLSLFNMEEYVFFSKNANFLCGSGRLQDKTTAEGNSPRFGSAKLPAGIEKIGTEERNFPRYWSTRPPAGIETFVQARDFNSGQGAKQAVILAVSPDYRWLVTGEKEQGFLWDLAVAPPNGQLRFVKNLGEIAAAVFTFDSSWLVVSGGGKLHLFNVAGPNVGPLREISDARFPGDLARIALTPDGKRMAVVLQNGSIRIGDLDAPQSLTKLLPGFGSEIPTDVMFRADGNTLYSFSPYLLRVSPFRIEDLEEKARIVVGTNLNEVEWQTLRLGDYKKTFPDLPTPASRDQDQPFRNLLRGKLVKLLDLRKESLVNSPLKFGPKQKTAKEYKVRFSAGTTYVIDMRSARIDSYLILQNSKGRELLRDDDGGGYPNARIRYPCQADDDYTIIATTFDGRDGEFELTVASFPQIESTAPIDIAKNSAFINGELSEDDQETGFGPGRAYTVKVPAKQTCQLDLTSLAFEPMLRLEYADGANFAEAAAFDGRARIVCNTSDTEMTYRLVVIGVRGKAGSFKLQIKTQRSSS